ncbi:MAG: sigma-70 family RNA polymerase sigma factor [Planctomycetota bacterium]
MLARPRSERALELIERLRCVPRILAARNRMLGSPLDATELEDVQQQTLTVLWRKLPEFSGRSSIETWVYQIAVFEHLNAVRSRARRRDRVREQADFEPGAAVEGEVEYDDFSDIHAALEKLEPEDVLVVRAKHFDDKPFSAIATELNLAEGTVKGRYYRAMRRLTTLLAHRREDLTP